MHIGIDARMYGIRQRGIGRYVERLISYLAKIPTEHRYTLFTTKEAATFLKGLGGRFKIVVADVPWYGLKEQLVMPRLIRRARVDIMHWPHINVPYFCPAPYVVTVHDLVVLHFPNSRATTLPSWQYQLKLRVHNRLLTNALRKAKRIITVSHFTKRDLVRHLGVDEKKITVIYLGADKMLLGTERLPNPDSFIDYLAHAFRITGPYLLHVGSAYPHKNLENLVRAFVLLRTVYERNWQLALVGRIDYFYERLKEFVNTAASRVAADIIFTGEVSEKDLDGLYRGARLFVFPSLCEGFGLPPLEAMTRGAPVVAAKAGALPEILADAAYYFAPQDIDNMAQVLDLVGGSRSLQEELVEKGWERVKHFSWEKMAEETMGVYEVAGDRNLGI